MAIQRSNPDYINIGNGAKRAVNIISSNKFFNCEYVVINAEETKIEFTRPGLSFVSNQHKVSFLKGYSYCVNITKDLPLGKFEIDKDESNEGELPLA